MNGEPPSDGQHAGTTRVPVRVAARKRLCTPLSRSRASLSATPISSACLSSDFFRVARSRKAVSGKAERSPFAERLSSRVRHSERQSHVTYVNIQ